jgi:hypothetical protein
MTSVARELAIERGAGDADRSGVGEEAVDPRLSERVRESVARTVRKRLVG